MLELQNLTKVYPNGNKSAVDNLNLRVESGEIFGFLGPNGAGKSTTIKMIVSLLSPTSGEIFVDGKSLSASAMEVKKLIGYVSDDHAVPVKHTGREYLDFLGTMYDVPVEERQRQAEKYLKLFGLTEAVDSPIKTYSHGMKQKIMIVGSLLHNPKLWVLDEPMTGLDPQSSYNLKQIMRERADMGNTVFFSSHVIDVVEKVCDRVAIIDNGRLMAVDKLDAIRANNDVSLEQIFLTLTAHGEEVKND